MKKGLCIIVCLLIVFFQPICSNKYTYAETDVEVKIEENINEQLDKLDTSNIDSILESLNSEKFSDGFTNKIKQIINGDFKFDLTSFFSYMVSLFADDLVKFLPGICLIVAIAVLYSMISTINFGNNKGVKEIIHFVCFGSIVTIVVADIASIINLSEATLFGIKGQMDAVFPILLTLLTALGGTVSVGIYQPAMAILSGTIISVFTNILLPIFTFKTVFTIISNLTEGIRFNKFCDFFESCYKWIIGIVLTLFTAFVSLNGLMSGSIDSISLRTAKYTLKSGVPIIGGFISDGMGLIMASSSLIKNAVGVAGLFIMFISILAPVVKIIVLTFLLKLVAAVLEPIAEARVTNFISCSAKSISQVLALILGAGFMYLIVCGLIMCSCNLF